MCGCGCGRVDVFIDRISLCETASSHSCIPTLYTLITPREWSVVCSCVSVCVFVCESRMSSGVVQGDTAIHFVREYGTWDCVHDKIGRWRTIHSSLSHALLDMRHRSASGHNCSSSLEAVVHSLGPFF